VCVVDAAVRVRIPVSSHHSDSAAGKVTDSMVAPAWQTVERDRFLELLQREHNTTLIELGAATVLTLRSSKLTDYAMNCLVHAARGPWANQPCHLTRGTLLPRTLRRSRVRRCMGMTTTTNRSASSATTSMRSCLLWPCDR
jgi:hypothetical protein